MSGGDYPWMARLAGGEEHGVSAATCHRTRDLVKEIRST